ncbi:MAG: CRISPR-associated endonuclease Cas1, partial [Thiotrichaceae bacterium]|nr:CRISPR-associated endonuclease Cas1 [Thiotrichaceae bacterium]
MPKLQSLYLDSTKVEQVILDKQALKLIHHGISPRWFPLNRISRIIIFGQMLWDSVAINACMEHSIALTFSTQKGEIKGICQSINAKQSRFGEMLTQLISHIDGTEHLGQWFSAKQRQYKVNSLEQIHINVDEYDSDYMIEIFSTWLSDVYKTKKPQQLFNLLETLLFAHASEFLAHVFTLYQLNEHVTLNQMLS